MIAPQQKFFRRTPEKRADQDGNPDISFKMPEEKGGDCKNNPPELFRRIAVATHTYAKQAEYAPRFFISPLCCGESC